MIPVKHILQLFHNRQYRIVVNASFVQAAYELGNIRACHFLARIAHNQYNRARCIADLLRQCAHLADATYM